jgi:Flp pilus assembly protein TadB
VSIVVVACGWGVLVLAATRPIVQRVGASERARRIRPALALAEREQPRGSAVRVGRAGIRRALALLGPLGRVVRGWERRRIARRRESRLARELPAAIDLLAVAVSAGSTPYRAVAIAARWAPPAVGGIFATVLATCELGASFESALQAAAIRDRRIAPLTAVIATGTRLGAAVNDALARLAAESRRDLRRRSEARARTVPVRLLFPLVFLVLPAFGLLTVVPAVAAGFRGF